MNMNYPQIKPTLNLDFSNTKTLDPRINFRRGTPGAYYDGKTYAKAEENLIEYSEDFSNAYWSKSNASITSDDIDAPDGTVSSADKIVENTATSSHQIFAGGAGTLGKTYTLSYFVKTAGRTSCRISFSGEGSAVFNVSTGSVIKNQFLSASIESVGNDWYRVAATVIKTNSNEDVFIGPALDDGNLSYAGDGSSGLYIWGAQLEQRDTVTAYTSTMLEDGTSAPITKYQPQLMFASPDQPRFDHDVLTGESKGLLIEESRTNLIAYSQQIEKQATSASTHNRWVVSSSSNALLSLNNSIAPDGTLSASKFYADSFDFTPSFYQQVYTTDTTPETLTFSIFAKAGQANRYLQLFIGSGDVDGNPFVNFNLFDGTISRDDDSIGSIEDVGNGWYRCIITFTTVSTSGLLINPVVYLIDDVNAARAASLTGDGYSGIYIWGAQLEEGSFATSYIKTSGASATRSDDDANITGENFSSWYRQDEGSLYSEISTFDSRNSQARLTISDGTDNNRIFMAANIGDNILKVDGWGSSNIGDYDLNINDFEVDKIYKKSFGLKRNDYFISINGQSQSGITSQDIPLPLVNRLDFSTRSTSHYVNGHIKKLSYYPQRLTNEQLQQLTK
jgi:hypothetical protein